MTSLYDAFDPSNFPYTIRYVDLPRDAVSIRRRRFVEAIRRDVLVIVGVAALVVAGIGIASARPSIVTEGSGVSDPVSRQANVQWRPSLVPLR